MKDRIPGEGKAGRVLITPEDGSAPFYATVTMADEPTEEGTALSKENLLTDAVAALYGLNGEAVPNDVLRAIATDFTTLEKLSEELDRYSFTPSGVVEHFQGYSWDETGPEWFTLDSVTADTGLTYGRCVIHTTTYHRWSYGSLEPDTNSTPACGMSCELPVGGVGFLEFDDDDETRFSFRYFFDGKTVFLQYISDTETGISAYRRISANVFMYR